MPFEKRQLESLIKSDKAYNSFIVEPKLEITGQYNSNVRSLSGQDDEDYSVSIKPSLFIEKKYSGHTLSAYANANIEQFADLTDENKENLEAGLRANFDLNSRWSIPASVSYSKKARSRDTPQTQNITTAPEDIHRFTGSFGLTHHFNRLSISVQPYARSLEYDDGVSLTTDAPVVFSDDDRTEIGTKLRFQYDFLRGQNDKPEHSAFLDLKYEDQDFKNLSFVNGSFSGNDGDNKRYSALAGFKTSYKDLLFAHIGAGYTDVQYDSNTLEDIDLMNVEADISYLFTPKWELGLNGYRRINQDNDFRQGIEDTVIALKSNYELRHNLFLSGSAFYQLYDFINNTREDDNIGADIALRYLNSQYLETALKVGYYDRDSNQSAQDYDRMSILLSLIGKI